MKNILTIMSKEFARFFTDKRMILMTILPAILIYVVYSFMGTMVERTFGASEDHTPWIYAVNAPDSITRKMQAEGISIYHIEMLEVEASKDKIKNREADLLMIFPENFDAIVDAFDVRTATGPAPNIEIYYMSTEPNSQIVYLSVVEKLDEYEESLANKFDINRGIENDLATPEAVMANIISTMMPMLLMVFLYSGCMGLALESITGEKERGTLATLLVSPLKRSELAIGKILSLAALSFLSGLVTAVATIMALPNLMGGGAGGVLDVAIYRPADYAFLAFIILSTLLLMVAMISIVSAFSRTVKEAGQAAMPLMIIVMLVGVSGMFGGGAQTDPIYYLVPLYGSVQSMSGIFSMNYEPVNIIIACLSSIVYAGLGGFVLTKMFNNEKVMFSR